MEKISAELEGCIQQEHNDALDEAYSNLHGRLGLVRRSTLENIGYGVSERVMFRRCAMTEDGSMWFERLDFPNDVVILFPDFLAKKKSVNVYRKINSDLSDNVVGLFLNRVCRYMNEY